MLIVKLAFPDQYQACLMFTQNLTSNTIANKMISEPDLPRQKRDLAFPDVSQMRSREKIFSCRPLWDFIRKIDLASKPMPASSKRKVLGC